MKKVTENEQIKTPSRMYKSDELSKRVSKNEVITPRKKREFAEVEKSSLDLQVCTSFSQ